MFVSWCTSLKYFLRCCNILPGHNFLVHRRGIPISVHRWGCAEHHLSYTLQPQRGHPGMGQVLMAVVGWWNIVQVRMLQRILHLFILHSGLVCVGSKEGTWWLLCRLRVLCNNREPMTWFQTASISPPREPYRWEDPQSHPEKVSP